MESSIFSTAFARARCILISRASTGTYTPRFVQTLHVIRTVLAIQLLDYT